jgi:hypothetical protein
MQNSAISFMACFTADEIKSTQLEELLSDKFSVDLVKGHTLLTVFNYNDKNSELKSIVNNRSIALEQKSSSALQLLLRD